MGKIILEGYITVPLEELDEVRAALQTHIQLTNAEPGCLIFKVDEDAAEPGRFYLYEEFVDQEAFDSHQARVKASPWGQISQNVARSYEIRGG